MEKTTETIATQKIVLTEAEVIAATAPGPGYTLVGVEFDPITKQVTTIFTKTV